MTAPPADAYIALGANLGDRQDNLRRALRLITCGGDVACVAVSRIYETEPVGRVSDQPDYLNAVAGVRTQLSADELLERCLSVESELGRVRREPGGPRIIDLDLLLFGDALIDRAHLHVPHPRLHLRRFVLTPLAEIAGEVVHPVLKQPIAALLANLPTDGPHVQPTAFTW